MHVDGQCEWHGAVQGQPAFVMSVEVCGRHFTSKSELVREFDMRKARLKDAYGTKNITCTDEDYVWMWELIKGHSRGETKTAGACRFRLMRSGDIYLVDKAGGALKDSRGRWVCVGKGGLIENRFGARGVASRRQNVFKVMRNLVDDQVKDFRSQAGNENNSHDMHVGHGADGSSPFGAMVAEFLCASAYPSINRVEDIEIERVSPNSGNYQLASGKNDAFYKSFACEWQTYHRKHAKLFMQNAKVNLSDNHNNKRKLWETERSAFLESVAKVFKQ